MSIARVFRHLLIMERDKKKNRQIFNKLSHMVLTFLCYMSQEVLSQKEGCEKGLIIIGILPKGRSFTANSGTKAAVLLKARSSTANSGTRAAVLLGMDRCGSLPLLSAPHSLFSIWTDLKRTEKIPGAPMWRLGEWIGLTGPSGLHLNSPQGLNIGSIRVFWPDQGSGNPNQPSPPRD